MFGKLLLTAAVILVAYLVLRARHSEVGNKQDQAPGSSSSRRRPPLLPRAAVRVAAYGLVLLMVAGSGLYLVQSWRQQQELVWAQVVNPYTGEVQRYETRRGLIDGRSFRTLDGRRVRIAEMERLIIEERR